MLQHAWEPAFAEAVGGEYAFSEYNLLLDPATIKPSAAASEALSLKQATPDDANEIADLSMEGFGEDEDKEEIRSWIAKDILRPARRFFFIKLHKQSIGTIGVVESAPDKIDITTFCILSLYRRHGYGRRILQQVVDMLLAEGWAHITLDVETENANALSLYLSCGFQQANVYNYYHIAL